MANRGISATMSDGITYDIGLTGLFAGICDLFNLRSQVSQMLPKAGPHVKVDCGLLFTIMVTMLCTRNITGLSSVAGFVARHPSVFALANPVGFAVEQCVIQALNRYVCADLLDRIAAYGSARFVMDLMASMVDSSEVTIARGDSTSYHLDGAMRAELPEDGVELSKKQRKLKESMAIAALSSDRNPIVLTRGYSRDNHPHNVQVNQFGLCARTSLSDKPLMLYQSAFSGNANDISYFARTMEADLEQLLEKYPYLRYIVFDSAGCTERMIRALVPHGVHLLSRVADKNKQVKQVLKQCEEQQIELTKLKVQYCGEEREIEIALLGERPLTAKADSPKLMMMLVKADALRDQKIALVKGRADRERESLEGTLKDMAPAEQPAFACEADARKAFKDLNGLTRLCRLSEPTIEEVRKHKKAGRPAAGDNGEIVGYNVRATVEIDDDAVAKAIEHELYYVLGSTDPNINPRDLFEFYHEQSDIEGCWRDIKLPGAFLDAFHIKSPSRIRALLAVVTIALNIQRIALTQIWSYLRERELVHLLASGQGTQRPCIQTLLSNHDLCGARFHLSSEGFRFEGLGPDTMLSDFLRTQCPEVTRYYSPQTYLEHYGRFKMLHSSNMLARRQKIQPASTPLNLASEDEGSIAYGASG